MATATTTTITENHQQQQQPRSICFSFAAYSQTLINHLHKSNIPISPGLTDSEITSIQSIFHFTFPPDLRSILQQGLPVGPGFPNWRSFSTQQLQILTTLPILGLSKEISRNKFWFDSWGDRPINNDDALNLAKGFLKNTPVLVPIYKHCYISCTPCEAGNPVFYINGGDVRLWSYDVVAFFQSTEFKNNDAHILKRPTLSNLFSTPAWAATEAKKIEFWTELVEMKEQEAVARGDTRLWWRGKDGGLGECMDEGCWRLREAGWKEEEIREMMMMDGDDENRSSWSRGIKDLKDREALVWHVRLLSMRLLRAGWSTGDVVDSLGQLLEGYQKQQQQQQQQQQNNGVKKQEGEIQIQNKNKNGNGGDVKSSWVDFDKSRVNGCDDEVKTPRLRELMKMGVGSSPLFFTQFRL